MTGILIESHFIQQIEPIIEQEHESLVHHMLLYACNFDISPITADQAHGQSGHCNSDEHMKALQKCQSIFAAWAIGSGVSDLAMSFHFFNDKQNLGIGSLN